MCSETFVPNPRHAFLEIPQFKNPYRRTHHSIPDTRLRDIMHAPGFPSMHASFAFHPYAGEVPGRPVKPKHRYRLCRLQPVSLPFMAESRSTRTLGVRGSGPRFHTWPCLRCDGVWHLHRVEPSVMTFSRTSRSISHSKHDFETICSLNSTTVSMH